jgi:hypothetical protein
MMGVPIQGSPAKNLPAVALCQERGWGAGTVLRSARWSQPRAVIAVQRLFVVLRSCHKTTTDRVRSFPPDIAQEFVCEM